MKMSARTSEDGDSVVTSIREFIIPHFQLTGMLYITYLTAPYETDFRAVIT